MSDDFFASGRMKKMEHFLILLERNIIRFLFPDRYYPYSIITNGNGIVVFKGTPEEASAWLSNNMISGTTYTVTTNFFK